MTDSRARSDEQAIEAAPGAGGAWATKAHIASQVSSASHARDRLDTSAPSTGSEPS